MKHSLRMERTRGFTLIELVVTMAIAAVLMMVAVPSFVNFQRNSQLTSLTNSLVASIYAARGEAMKTGFNAFVVPTANGSDWTTGWIVFVDNNGDGSFSAADDTLVQTQPALEGYFTASGTGSSGQTPAYIMFSSSGYSKTKSGSSFGTGGFGALTMSIARSDAPASAVYEETRRITISSTGRLRTCKPLSATDNNCKANSDE